MPRPSTWGWYCFIILTLSLLVSPLATLVASASPYPSAEKPAPEAEPDASSDEASQGVEERLSIDEVLVVTATARPEAPSELPFVTDKITAAELLSERLERTVPEALAEVPGVMAQKTSHGQGSPYLRGFTGFRTLFLIDGIRLNHSAMRDGPNPYWNTVDAFGLESLEVVKGPATVLYGSETVGGTVQALTPDVPLDSGRAMAGDLHYRWASAEHSSVGRLDLTGSSGAKWSYALGVSSKGFGDLEAAGVEGKQPYTGYDERDLDLKLRWAVTADSELVAVYQQVEIDDAWRTHKTVFGRSWRGTTVGDEKRRVLDQRRSLAYLQLHHASPGPFYDSLTASLSLQRHEEERDRVRADDRRDLQGFDVATWGAWVRMEKASRFGTWTWGLESYRDSVDSFKHRFDAAGGLTRSDIQGPVADDAAYRLSGVYVQNQLPAGRLRLILGARYTRAEADARAVEDPQTGERIAVTGAWDEVVSSVRFTLPFADGGHWQLFGGVSQAFRAPNLSDLTRFDSARSNEIETPSPALAPESFLAWELGLRWQTARASAEIAAFHTAIDDLIIRVPTGEIVDGELEVTKSNGGDGFSGGLEAAAQLRLGGGVSAFADLAWIDGEVDTYATADSRRVREPLDRLMPLTAHLGVRWQAQGKPYWIEALATWAARQDRLSSRDRADTQRIPPGGTPEYRVLTLRGGWNLGQQWGVSAAVENLTDREYRVHGSGLNEPGRNIVLAVETGF